MNLPGRFKVVRTDAELQMPRTDAALQNWGGTLVLLPDATPEAALAQAVADADLLLMCYARITRRVIEGATRLKAIVKYGVGIDAIDLDAARERGIPVVNVPAYAEQTVAEGAFLLLLALAKRVKPLQREMAERGWAWPEPRWLGRDLAGRTLGLVGCGRIGRCMARMAGAFGMTVLAVDPALAPDDAPPGVTLCASLEQMLPRCDAVSIHCTLNPGTHHLLGAPQFAAMKHGAWLVNVSRGEICDEAALLAALRSGQLGGAGLDVYGQEPLALQGHALSALFAMDNVILWPHLAFYTHEAMQRLEDETLARCREALLGLPLTVHSTDPRLRAQQRGVRFDP
jgi:D-3-phosphoglycerate dehydrogenase